MKKGVEYLEGGENTMKKKMTAMISLTLVLLMALPLSVSAVVPGFSDYDTTPTVTITEETGNISKVSPETGVAVNVSAAALPQGITEVTLQVKSFTRRSNEVRDMLRTLEPADRTRVVSVVNLNLLDQDNASVRMLQAPASFTIPVPRGVDSVRFIHPATGAVVVIQGTVANGFLTFETNYLGYFILIRGR